MVRPDGSHSFYSSEQSTTFVSAASGPRKVMFIMFCYKERTGCEGSSPAFGDGEISWI